MVQRKGNNQLIVTRSFRKDRIEDIPQPLTHSIVVLQEMVELSFQNQCTRDAPNHRSGEINILLSPLPGCLEQLSNQVR
jgi:hypothetical protein